MLDYSIDTVDNNIYSDKICLILPKGGVLPFQVE